jgi:hypothetical protein
MGYNVVYCIDSKPKFRSNISPPSFGSKDKQRKNPTQIRLQGCYLLYAGSLINHTIPELGAGSAQSV